jgi:di/tripeptidase
VPFNCSVSIHNFDAAIGWNCRKYEPWFQEAINQSSKSVFGSDSFSICEGGSVPIISILAKEYKDSQIVVTGVLGPQTNAHGPNECIDLTYTLKFTQSMAEILALTCLHWSKA